MGIGFFRRVRRVCRFATPLGVGLSLWLSAFAASASPDTLRLAIEDVVLGAADIVVAPANGCIATVRNLDEVSDNGFLQGLYFLPAQLGLTTLQVVQGALRLATGVVELVPGILLFPFQADLSAEFNVFRRGELMVDLENPLARKPPWLAYLPLATPLTIDVRIGPLSAWASEPEPSGPGMGAMDDRPPQVGSPAREGW